MLCGGHRIKCGRYAARVFAILAPSFGRFLRVEDINELAWSDVPDCEVPKRSSVMIALNKLRGDLLGTGFTVQKHARHGFRLIDVETLRLQETRPVTYTSKADLRRYADSLRIAPNSRVYDGRTENKVRRVDVIDGVSARLRKKTPRKPWKVKAKP